MALRLARAFTGRSKLVRFKGHFHGWHDHMTSGHTSHFDGAPTTGVLDGVSDAVLLAEPNDVAGITRLFDAHKDIAAVILEPTGANFGRMPIDPGFLAVLRALTRQAGALLVFDEVVTGFRVSPGGAQAELGVTPDLTTLAKILAGGLPGGAVAGRQDVLELLDFAAAKAAGREKIAHPGTYNANPLSAAAGVAALEVIAETDACGEANRFAARLRDGLNEVLAEAHVPWAVHGSYSGFHIYTNPDRAEVVPGAFDAATFIPQMLGRTRGEGITGKVRLGMLAHGVDINGGPSGLVSATHGAEELAVTVDAWRATLHGLRRDGLLA